MVILNFEEALEQSKRFTANPEELKKAIIDTFGESPRDSLVAPYADRLAFWSYYFRGFARFPDRLKNYIQATLEPHNTYRSFMPYIADIEPNSRCNFKCTMCQVSEWKGARAADMSYEQLTELYAQNPMFTEIKLHGMGEPFLHKRFTDMVAFLSEKDIWVRTSTNGSLLHKNENYKKLIDAEIGEVQCSLDGATADVYQSIRVGGNFEEVVKNFTLLNKYANQKDRLYSRMWVVIQKNNRHQLLDFVEIARKMEFRRVSFSISLNDWGQEEWKQKNSEKEANKLTREEKELLVEMKNKYGIDITVWEQASKYEKITKPCYWPQSRPYISSDMKIVPCCMIGNPDVISLGDANDFSKAWNSDEYKYFRKLHIDGEIPDCCKSCYA